MNKIYKISIFSLIRYLNHFSFMLINTIKIKKYQICLCAWFWDGRFQIKQVVKLNLSGIIWSQLKILLQRCAFKIQHYIKYEIMSQFIQFIKQEISIMAQKKLKSDQSIKNITEECNLFIFQGQITSAVIENPFSQKLNKLNNQRFPRKKIVFNQSTWTFKENLLYKQFLKENQTLFQIDKQIRKNMKINLLMSKYIKTRSADQCRSHHQKMIKSHKNILAIILYIQKLEVDRMRPLCNENEKIQSISKQETSQLESLHQYEQKQLLRVDSQYLWENKQDHLWWDGFTL